MKFKYTITKFDKENKTIVVTFDDNHWAEIRLVNPLPKTLQDLENIIKQFTAPLEAIEAQINPDADLTYIDSAVGIEKECDRLKLNNKQPETPPKKLDSEVEANMEMWADIQFQQKVGDALVALGVLTSNPATIPVSE